MKKILKKIEKENFNIQNILMEDKEITHIYASFEDISFCFIAPHSGNKQKYIMRVNPTITLDRWINSDLESVYASEEELVDDIKVNNIIKYLMYIYIDYYLDDKKGIDK